MVNKMTSSDEEIRLEVLDSISSNPRISDPASIKVDVKNGIVTLSGEVDTYFAQLAARESAEQVPSVNAIVQEIQVKIPESTKKQDSNIAKSAVYVLDSTTSIPLGRDQPVVKDGIITLVGSVPQSFHKREAERSISRIRGIKGVINNLEVAVPVTTSDIQQKIADAFRAMAMHHARGIRIEVQNDRVILRGMVYSWIEKMKAEQVVKNLLENSQVVNNLEISPLLEGKEIIQ